MRIESIGIAAAELWLPPGRELATTAVAEGRLRAREAADLGHPEVPDAGAEAPPELAVAAATGALKQAGADPADLAVVCHAWMYYQGHDLWSPAHYVAAQLGARDAFPFGVQQVCNGGTAGLELTATRLAAARAAEPERELTGLVTTADRFTGPGFDRWSADYGVVYGDGAAAVLLRTPSTAADVLLLRSVVTVAAPELEAMHRGADPFAPAARTRRERVDMRATKRAYLVDHGNEQFLAANRQAITGITATALAEAGLAPDDPRLTCAVLPRFGRKALDTLWRPALAGRLRTELVDFGRTTGHLGAGDALASVAELAAQRLLEPGEAALVFSAGAGFTWSCLVVEAPDSQPAG